MKIAAQTKTVVIDGADKLSSKLSRRWGGSLGAMAVTLVGLAAWWFPVSSQWLAGLSYDVPFYFKRSSASDGVVIVSMEESSYRELKQDPLKRWNRLLHAKLLRHLTRCGASVVVFDVWPDQEWEDPSVDDEFAAAIREHGKVVLAADVVSIDHEIASHTLVSERLLTPPDNLATNARVGIAVATVDPDGILRRFPRNDALWKTLAFHAAELSGLDLPANDQERWINYLGMPGTIRTVAYHEVLKSDMVRSNLFQGKVVFIGQGKLMPSRLGKDDLFETPTTRWKSDEMSGVEIHATAFLNIVEGTWLRQVPISIQAMVIVGLGSLLGFLAMSYRPAHILVVPIIIAMLCGAIGIALHLLSRWWLPWLVCSAVQVPAAFLLCLVANSQRLPAYDFNKPGGYKLIRLIGQGAYGEVWLGENDVEVRRAVKQVWRKRFPDKAAFRREYEGIRNTMSLSGELEHLVQIYHVETLEQMFYYVMELADDLATGKTGHEVAPADYNAKTLRKMLDQGRYSIRECVSLGKELAKGLHELHSRKRVHRDIKPANIIFVKGRLKYGDIGCMIKQKDNPTIVGTPGYLDEQSHGTPQGDIFSLGIVLYEMATGYSASDFPKTPIASKDLNDSNGVWSLNQVILKASGQLEERYPTAIELYEALEQLEAELR